MPKDSKSTNKKKRNNKIVKNNKIQEQSAFKNMISSDMEEKNAASYADSLIDHKAEDCNVSQDNELNLIKSKNVNEDKQQINQSVDILQTQNDYNSINWNLIPSLNQAMTMVADGVMSQNQDAEHAQEPSKASTNEAIQRKYSSSLSFDNTASSTDDVVKRQSHENTSKDQKASDNTNGFFHHDQNQKTHKLMWYSDSSNIEPIVASKRRNPEKPPNVPVNMTSNTAVDLATQLPSEQPTEHPEDNQRPRKGCCSIM